MQMSREFNQCHLLQSDQTSSEFKGALGIPIASDVTIEIGSGQNDKQRQFRMETVKFFDRWIAAPGVERDQQIAARPIIGPLNVNTMAQLT
jgi:hypothetical protein